MYPYVHCSTIYNETWKKTKCPLKDEWIKKMCYIYTMEHFSAINKNEIMPFVATWMELEILTLTEVRKRKTYHMISHIWNPIYSTDEPIYRKDTNSWTWRTVLWWPRWRGRQWDGLGVWG